MPRYQVSYVDPRGRPARAYVEGPSVDWVRAHLAGRGASDVRVHREDVLPAAGRNLAEEGKSPPRSPRETALRAAVHWALCIGVFVVAGALHPRDGANPGAWWLALGMLAFAALTVSPVLLNAALDRAVVRHEWRRALRLLPWLAWNPLLRAPALRFRFASQRARALAALGRIDEALAVLDAIAPRTGVSLAVLESTRADLFIRAHRYDDAFAARRRAAAADPKLTVDAAIALLRYGGDVDEARALLASRDGVSPTEVERAFREYAHGLLAIADHRYVDALARLAEADLVFRRELVRTPDHLEGITSVLDAYRALALASSGEGDAAAKLLAPVEPFLAATDQAPLLARCRDAIDRARAHAYR